MTTRREISEDEAAAEADPLEEHAAELGGGRGATARLYALARRALGLARVYGLESGTSGRRERECLVEVSRLRRRIAELRGASRSDETPEGAGLGPGLRKPDRGASPLASSRAATKRAG